MLKVIFDPTEPALTPHEMRELVKRTKEQLTTSLFPPLLVIANFVFEFLAIHPFQDGNGRLSRLLTQLLMLQQGYGFTAYASHESVIESEKIAYYQALNKTQVSRKTDSENMIPWLDFFLGVVRQQGLKAIAIGTQNQIEVNLSPRQLNIRRLLQSERQATRKRLSEQSGIPYDTVGQILQKLVKMGKIEKRGSTRGTVYVMI